MFYWDHLKLTWTKVSRMLHHQQSLTHIKTAHCLKLPLTFWITKKIRSSLLKPSFANKHLSTSIKSDLATIIIWSRPWWSRDRGCISFRETRTLWWMASSSLTLMRARLCGLSGADLGCMILWVKKLHSMKNLSNC